MSVATNHKSISARKLAANRANARKSTGPRSAAGKARSARNATTHGLFCHAAVLPGEDELAFARLRAGMMLSLNPQDTVELMLVDRIVLANWKLRRLQETEFFINRADQHEMLSEEESEEYQQYDALMRSSERKQKKQELVAFFNDTRQPIPAAAILAAQISREDGKSFERMSRYEQRLENQVLRMMRELRQLRKDRKKDEPEATSEFTEDAVAHCKALMRARDTRAQTVPAAPPSPGMPGEGRGEGSVAADNNSVSGRILTPTLSQNTGRGSDKRDPSKMKNEATKSDSEYENREMGDRGAESTHAIAAVSACSRTSTGISGGRRFSSLR